MSTNEDTPRDAPIASSSSSRTQPNSLKRKRQILPLGDPPPQQVRLNYSALKQEVDYLIGAARSSSRAHSASSEPYVLFSHNIVLKFRNEKGLVTHVEGAFRFNSHP